MHYLSVCSGIEAASVAWASLDWTPIAFSEIEPFPSAVLAFHYPTVPNLGDMTKFHEWPDLDVDLVVGGTPCQAFSVAGLREGLNDPRGNLTLTFIGVVKKYSPKFVIWENVPGVLTDKTRALHSFMDGLEEIGYAITGFDILDAQFFGVAQRRRRLFVCAQKADDLLNQRTEYSAFIVLQCLCEIWRSGLGVLCGRLSAGAENLVSGDTEQLLSLKKKMRSFGLQRAEQVSQLLQKLGETLPSFVSERVNSGSSHGNISKEVSQTSGDIKLGASQASEAESIEESPSIGRSWLKRLGENLAGLNAFITSTSKKEITDEEIYIYAETLLSIAEYMLNLTESSVNSLPAVQSCSIALQEFTNYARSTSHEVSGELGRICRWNDFALQADVAMLALSDFGDGADTPTILPFANCLRGNPAPSREAREETAGTLSARTEGGGGLGTDFDLAGGLQASTGGADENDTRAGRLVCAGTGIRVAEIAPTLNARFGDKQGLENQHIDGGGCLLTPEISHCLNAGAMGRLDYETETLLATRRGGFFNDTAHTLRAEGFDASEDGTGRGTPLVAIPILEACARTGKSTTDIRAGSGIGNDGDPMFTLQRGKQHAIAFGAKGSGADAQIDLSPTLRAAGHDKSHANGGSMPAVAFNWNAQVDQMNFYQNTTPALTRSQEAAIGPVAFQTRIARNGRGQPSDIPPTLNGSDAGAMSDMRPCVQVDMAVRRLTPKECERLQGFPDYFTDIPVGKNGKRSADGPRYKALGNSMAVPCMEYIGRRIAMVIAKYRTPEIELE